MIITICMYIYIYIYNTYLDDVDEAGQGAVREAGQEPLGGTTV